MHTHFLAGKYREALEGHKVLTLTYDSGLQVDEDGTWHVFTGTSLAEERIKGVISSPDSLVRWHLAVWLDTVLQTVELPACVSDLDTGLSDVDRNTLTL